MCEPTTIAATALAVKAGTQIAGSIVGGIAENKASSANARAANSAAAASQNALEARRFEERIAAGQQIEEGTRQVQSASALARLSAIEAGVAGPSADAVLQTISAQGGRYQDSIKQNLYLALQQIDREGFGVEAERQARIASKPRRNPFLTGLEVVGAVADYATARAASKPSK